MFRLGPHFKNVLLDNVQKSDLTKVWRSSKLTQTSKVDVLVQHLDKSDKMYPYKVCKFSII